MQPRKFIPYLILIAAVFAAYGNVYANPFFYDDEFLVVKNLFLRDWSGLFRVFGASTTAGSGLTDSFYRPLQEVLYVFVYQLFGPEPFAFHLLNVSLHAANVGLVFLLGQRLRFSPQAAFCAALLWAMHPTHVEAITYISSTADTLHTLFILAGLLLFLRESHFALPLMLLALLSKESAVVFPALAFACLYFLSTERFKLKTYLRTWPYWLMAFAYMLARKTFLNFDHTYEFYKTANLYTENIGYRALTFLATLPAYGKVLLWPFDLHFDRGFQVFTNFDSALVRVGILMALAAAAALFWERKFARPVMSLAVLWFAAAHTPHSGVLLPVNSFFLEHWLYLTTIGLFFAVGAGLAMHKFGFPLVGILAAYWGVLTWQQNEVWADPVTFYERVLEFEPKVGRAHNNLAMIYSDRNEHNLAIEHYKKAIELYDIYPQTHHNLGLEYLRLGREAEGKEELLKALRLDPDFFQSSVILAKIYEKEADARKAREFTEKAEASAKKRRGNL